METLGWAGLGEIGTPMAVRLAAVHPLLVWNRSAARLGIALEAGAGGVPTPAELGARCSTVFVCVTDGEAVEQIVFGPGGVLAGTPAVSLIVDHSTIHPDQARAFAARARGAGIGWVDAPVSGGPAGARAGTLACFAGGSDDDVARARPWIAAYAQNVTHAGPAGSGQVAKSCNQAVVASTVALWAEVIAYARLNGLDPVRLIEMVAGGWADSPIARAFGPAMAAGATRSDRHTLILKDLDIVDDVARSARAAMPVTSVATALFRMALARAEGPAGMTALMHLYER